MTVMAFDQVAEFLAGEAGKHHYVMLVGCEGSGKTTLSKAIKKRHGFKRLSLDRMVKKQPYLAMYPEQLMDEYVRKLRRHIRNRLNVIDDGKKLSAEERLRALKVVRSYHSAHVVIVHMDIPLETCKEWNSKRKVQAPDSFVEFSWKSLQRPDKSEGRVIRLTPVGDWKFEVTEV